MPDLPPRSRQLLAAAALVILALLALDLVAWTLDLLPPDWRRFVDITKERNLPTAVSVALLLLCAGAAAGQARRAAAGAETAGWIAIALFFTYMAVDDALRLHEEAATEFSRLLEREAGHHPLAQWFLQFPSYYWQLLFMPVFGTFALLLLTFVLRRLGSATARLLLLGGLGCYALAVLLDFLEGSRQAFGWITETLAPILTVPETRHLMRAYEEAIEMLGTAALAASLLAATSRARHRQRPADGTESREGLRTRHAKTPGTAQARQAP